MKLHHSLLLFLLYFLPVSALKGHDDLAEEDLPIGKHYLELINQ
jgi:hypothetical protein